MKNGQQVAAFEKAFAEYVGARFAIALCNGTATLHTALVALGVNPGDKVAVPPLTMSATTIAVLHAGAVPEFCDVDPDTWLSTGHQFRSIGVSLYGLHGFCPDACYAIDDAAQTLRRHYKENAFTSYSFQASKILALGEGGMLVTDDEELATKAREFSSLGYRMRADQPRIDPDALKSPSFDRHYSLGWNYRMNDLTAARGLELLPQVRQAIYNRRFAMGMYDAELGDCEWATPQHVPSGWQHDGWTWAIACDTPERALKLSDAVVKHGGERPYPAWKLTYREPAFDYLARASVTFSSRTEYGPVQPLCPVAESLQPRLLQFQTNSLASAEKNAQALRKAIEEVGA